MLSYTKPHRTFTEQLELLKSRGLQISDDANAVKYLKRLGYYRISGYLYPFRKLLQKSDKQIYRSDEFIPGSHFQHAIELYVFDKRLRLLILDAIERVEVAIRVDIAYHLGRKDPFAHTKAELLHGNFTKKIDERTGRTKYQAWLAKHEQLTKQSKEEFSRHFKRKYHSPLPIWIAIELWDFGLLSKFYQGMTTGDKSYIAKKYNIPDWQLMESWLRCLNYIRNICAHHSRLWNKNLADYPKLPMAAQLPIFAPLLKHPIIPFRVYSVLCILIYFLTYISPNSSWKNRIYTLINNFPQIPGISIQDMGFPLEWKQHEFWNGISVAQIQSIATQKESAEI